MNVQLRTKRRPEGIMMLECLVYMSIFVLVIGVATALLYSSWSAANGIRRNCDDIVNAMHAGDQWRADVRCAIGAVQVQGSGNFQSVRIPARGGSITYSFENGMIHRRSEKTERVLLSNVKSSQFANDRDAGGKAWRWELELPATRKEIQIRPLFTFEAVEGTAAK